MIKNQNAISDFYNQNQKKETKEDKKPREKKTLGSLDLIRTVQNKTNANPTDVSKAESNFEMNPKDDKKTGWARSKING